MPGNGGTSQGRSQRFIGAAHALGPYAILFLAVCLTCALGVLKPLDYFLMDARFRLLERAPSGTLVIVEVDPKSVRGEERWPWTRDRYATAIANLQDAGATLIGFDIGFSSVSDLKGDGAFIDALGRRPGEVILPVFYQRSAGADGHPAMLTPPHPFFLRDAAIANVNLTAEPNGIVRRAWRGVTDGKGFRGSMASVLAERAGVNRSRFYIDYSIDPAEISRLSFRDVLLDDFPKEAVRGKKILIGATALELGDEYAAPIRGVLPGVVLHALSYESLTQGRAINRLHFFAPLAMALGVVIWLISCFRRWTWPVFITRNAMLAALLLGAPLATQALVPVSIDAGAMLAAQVFCIIYILGNRIHPYTEQILRQRAEMAHYQALTRLVVRDSADGVIVADVNGVIELGSARAQELLGAPAPLQPGGRMSDCAPGFPLHAPRETPMADASGAFVSEEAVCLDYAPPGGEGRALEILASAAGRAIDGDDDETSAQLVVYTLRDVSARKRIEAAEREAKEAALAASAVKTQLIANMSHELKTPLNSIIGFAELLKHEALGPLGASEYQDYSEMIHAGGTRLLGLVSDMLTVAKLQAGEYNLDVQPVAIREIIECCLEDVKLSHVKAGAIISTLIEGDLSSIEVDVAAFSDMLKRLLANALEYTSEHETVRINARRRGDGFVLDVVDNGCGVDARSLSKLKDVFYQADGALNRAHEGAGLGLFIVSELAMLHGGSLELRSKLGEGFLARLRFPGAVREKPTRAAA